MTGSSAPVAAAGSTRAGSPWMWALMGLVLLGALAVGMRPDNTPSTNDERAHAPADSLKCPTCRSQSVADSDAPVSKEIRSAINRRIEAGQSDAQIRAFLVGQFGEDVLLTPAAGGVTGLVWVIPVVVLIVAGVALGFAFRRWREASPVSVTEDDRELIERIRHDLGPER